VKFSAFYSQQHAVQIDQVFLLTRVTDHEYLMSYDYAFPFDWNTHFVPDRATDCMPACVAMGARYWASLRPQLNIPTDLETWRQFITNQKGMTMRGASLTRVMDNLGKTMHTGRPSQILKLIPSNLTNIEATIQYLSHDPPIPLILIFDRSYMITENEGGYHACLLYGIDYKKEKKVGLIDPNLVDSREAFRWDLQHFLRGWGITENQCVAVCPPELLHLKSKKGLETKPITSFMEEYK